MPNNSSTIIGSKNCMIISRINEIYRNQNFKKDFRILFCQLVTRSKKTPEITLKINNWYFVRKTYYHKFLREFGLRRRFRAYESAKRLQTKPPKFKAAQTKTKSVIFMESTIVTNFLKSITQLLKITIQHVNNLMGINLNESFIAMKSA